MRLVSLKPASSVIQSLQRYPACPWLALYPSCLARITLGRVFPLTLRVIRFGLLNRFLNTFLLSFALALAPSYPV